MKSLLALRVVLLLIPVVVFIQSCSPRHRPDTDQRFPGLPREETFLLEPLGVEFVLIPGGVFGMGSVDGLYNEKPAHKVRVSTFYLSRTEITQAQWTEVMGENPSYHAGCDNCPVERVTYAAVNDYLEKASKLSGVQVRLPTEAEWEYAAGSGTEHQRYAGTNEEMLLSHYAWYSDNSGGQTHPVGTKNPNQLGLFDMSGNVWEWCLDWYERDYYSKSQYEDPLGPGSGTYRVIKGGSFLSVCESVRTSRRVSGVIHTPDKTTGFRIAIDANLIHRNEIN